MEIMKHLIAATTLALALGACANEDEAVTRAEERAAVQALEAQREEVTQAMEMRWEARSKEPDQAAPSPEE